MSTFGLISQLANSRITLPLIHIETSFRITGEFAAVEMEQVFEQSAREPLDVTYTFPLPGDAAVYRCEMQVNGRLIRARVMDEQEARRTVAEKKAAGHRTALVEMDRENLFTLQLGNAAPGDQIVIRFAYFEKLDRLASSLSLRIPFSPGIRYIPGKPLLRKNRGLGSADDTDQVPDASRLSPPRISAAHPDAATIYIHGTLDADEVSLATISSPTHPAVIRPVDAVLEVELAGEQHVPDRDFVLRWDETATSDAKPKIWTSADATGRYALLQLRAPLSEATAAVSDDFAQDIYFLLDRSGSMSGGNWEQASRALHAFVRQLGAKDRVWLTCFESSFQDFSDEPMNRDDILSDSGFLNLADIGTAGGTELLPALKHVLEKRNQFSSHRSARLILITDGQVGNEHAILSLMRQKEQRGLPMHCFGIDRAVNDAFLKNLARVTGGRCALMTPEDNIPAAVEKLAHTLRRPVLTGLELQGGMVTPRETSSLPDLCAGDVLFTPVQLGDTDAAEVLLTGTLPDGSPHIVRYDVAATLSSGETALPGLLWAHLRIRHLLETAREPEAIQLAIDSNLICRGTAFVAWDESEKVKVAEREVYQPSQGMEYSLGEPGKPRRGSIFQKRTIDGAPVCAPPVTAGPFASNMSKQTHFFESKAYQDAPVLRDCTDDELMADAPADYGILYSHACPDTFVGSSNLWVDNEDSAPVLPRAVRELYQRFRSDYNTRWLDLSDASLPLMPWVQAFTKELTDHTKILEPVAQLFALILRHWALGTISMKRRTQLEQWLRELQAAPDFLSALRNLLSTATPSKAIKDATELLDCAMAHPIREKRSWIRRLIK